MGLGGEAGGGRQASLTGAGARPAAWDLGPLQPEACVGGSHGPAGL